MAEQRKCPVCQKEAREECGRVVCGNRRPITAQPVGHYETTRGRNEVGESLGGGAYVRRPRFFEG